MQIAGGKEDEYGVPRAYVLRVKKGSVAESVGNLKPGDEIIMWNEHRFRGASLDEVYEAIQATKSENSVSNRVVYCNVFTFCFAWFTDITASRHCSCKNVV